MSEPRRVGLDRVSPLILFLGLFGVPAAGLTALVLAEQIPRFLYGQSLPLLLLFAAEMSSVLTLLILFVMLRLCLALPSAPRGLYRDALDFVAMARWHPAVKAALAGLIVLPPAWYIHGDPGFIQLLRILGVRALTSGDFRDDLDRVAVTWQLAFMGGVPLLFLLHMLTRRKPRSGVLAWLLIPVIFVGTAIAAVVIVTILH
jgi:hypothetical protein